MAARINRRGFGSIAGFILGVVYLFPAPADAGGFSVREQSTTFLGSAFAGSAAGGDISSIYWNSAATGLLTGCNMASSYSLVLGSSSDVTAEGGILATGVPS